MEAEVHAERCDAMSDLEKLRKELESLPTQWLGKHGACCVQYWPSFSDLHSCVNIENPEESIMLEAEEALKLLEWLQGQRSNLERLRDAMKAAKIKEKAEIISRDTDQTPSAEDLVSALDRISEPVEEESVPLPFDPDDYPVSEEITAAVVNLGKAEMEV